MTNRAAQAKEWKGDFMKLMISRTLLVLAFSAGFAGVLLSQNNAAGQGTVQRIQIHGKALEGNLLGETADPNVTIYLPPGYQANQDHRYPVLYLLHGAGGDDTTWTGRLANVPQIMDRVIANKTVRDMIVVMPASTNRYGGSFYSSSMATGDWESFIAREIVSYMDSHYRTIADRGSRGLAGHSMGGYGTFRIGMKHPDVFSSLYNLSACCLLSNPVPQAQPNRGGNTGGARGAETTTEGARGQAPRGNLNYAFAAAWSPNPSNAPDYVDLPVKDGQPQPAIVAKWHANSALAMVDQYIPNLRKYRAIGGDVGLQDNLLSTNQQMAQTLNAYGLNYKFETYEGDHTNRIADRVEMKLLPFFSQNLNFAAPKRR
jgi:enterochelin esterase-like enzyme